MVARLEEDVPGSRHGLVHMVDAIKELESKTTENVRPARPTPCPLCNAPTSGDICKGCEFIQMLKEVSE